MHERSKADAFSVTQTVSLRRRSQTNILRYILARETFPLCMIVSQRERAIHQSFEIDFLANDLISSGRLAFFDEVAEPKFIRSQSDSLRDTIHVSFQRKDALRCAKSSKSAMRRRVRRHGGAPDTHVRAEIGTGRMNRAARKHDRRERAVSPAVDHKIDLLGQKFSIFRHGGLVSRA